MNKDEVCQKGKPFSTAAENLKINGKKI